MLGQHAGDMGMVMLDANFLGNVCVEGVFCCQVVGMQVIGNRLGINIEDALEMFNSFAVRGQCFQVLQVANVMADKGLSSLAQTEGILEMSATGHQWHGKIE